MPCDTTREPPKLMEMARALDRLQKALGAGTVSVVVGASGALAFKGWQDRGGLSDLCAYRKLQGRNAPELRKAVARAEALAGRRLDERAIAAGVHSHDGGKTWGAH